MVGSKRRAIYLDGDYLGRGLHLKQLPPEVAGCLHCCTRRRGVQIFCFEPLCDVLQG
jgi:hypothetical protein